MLTWAPSILPGNLDEFQLSGTMLNCCVITKGNYCFSVIIAIASYLDNTYAISFFKP